MVRPFDGTQRPPCFGHHHRQTHADQQEGREAEATATEGGGKTSPDAVEEPVHCGEHR